MKKNIFYTLALLLLYSGSILGQKNSKTIQLSLEKTALEIAANFPFRIDSILDGRSLQYAIGMGFKGADNRIVPIFFETGLSSELKNVLNRSLPQKADQKPVSIRVNKFYLYEIGLENIEISCIEMNVSFLEKKEGQYIELYTVGTALESKTMLDATLVHRKNIKKALEYCLETFQKQAAQHSLWQKPFDINLPGDSIFKRFEVQQMTEVPSKGYFKTFEAFRDNMPQTDREFMLKSEKTTPDGNILSEFYWSDNTAIKSDEVWGLSDGKFIYINAGKKFIRLDKKGGYFTLNISIPKKGDQSGAVIGSLVGGLIGGIIGTLIDQAKSDDAIEPAYLDLATGSFIPVKTPSNRKQEGRVIIFYEEKTGEKANIFLNNNLKGTLKPGTAARFRFVPPYQQVEICADVNNAEKSCRVVDADLYQTEYYSFWIHKGEVQLSRMSDEEKTALRYKINREKVEVVEFGGF